MISRASKSSVGYLEQMGGLERSSTVYAEMRSVFADVLQAADRMRELEAQMHGALDVVSEEYSRLTAFFESQDGYLIDVKIKTVLNGMGFGEDTYDRVISSFSGGEKTRLAIAKLLLEEPNLLILDEPTNHLDFQTVLWLEEYRDFLRQGPRSVALENGRMAQVFYVPAAGAVTEEEVPEGCCQISGDNVEGFILTWWGDTHENG